MDIGTTPSVETECRKNAITFWDSFYGDFAIFSTGLHYKGENGYFIYNYEDGL